MNSKIITASIHFYMTVLVLAECHIGNYIAQYNDSKCTIEREGTRWVTDKEYIDNTGKCFNFVTDVTSKFTTCDEKGVYMTSYEGLDCN